MSELPIPESASNPAQRSRTLDWCLGAVVICGLGTMIGVFLPSRLKLLGLFPIFWGGLIGIGFRWLADELNVKRRNWSTLLVGFFVFATEVGMVLGGWMIYRSDLQRHFDKIPALQSPSLMPEPNLRMNQINEPTAMTPEIESAEDGVRRNLEAEIDARIRDRRRVQLELSTYLYRRILRLGDFSSPWPEFFWGSEIVFGTFAGVWCWKNVKVSSRIEGK